MKVVVAIDKFKGTIGAKDAAQAVADGLKSTQPRLEVLLAPMADGGEGTLDALLASGGRRFAREVTGPLGAPTIADFGVLPDGAAVIEMAQAAGFSLVPPARRNPLFTTTFGVGELIGAALDLGCRRFIVAIGGSATCDGGIGAMQALGAKVLAADGKQVSFGGAELVKISHIDIAALDERLKVAEFLVASDVTNPLFGPLGAAYVFAPQKGASPEDVKLLDQGLKNLAEAIKKDLGADVASLPGGGAAGGLGAGLVAFLQAKIKPGAELVAEAIDLSEKVSAAELVITGEGQIDEQSSFGKVPSAVARIARQQGAQVIAVSGRLGAGYEALFNLGIEQVLSLESLAGSAEAAMKNPALYLKQAGQQIAKRFL